MRGSRGSQAGTTIPHANKSLQSHYGTQPLPPTPTLLVRTFGLLIKTAPSTSTLPPPRGSHQHKTIFGEPTTSTLHFAVPRQGQYTLMIDACWDEELRSIMYFFDVNASQPLGTGKSEH